MSHEVETVAARQPMWHGLGNVTGEAVKAEQMIVAAGLDWTVEKKPLFFMVNGVTFQVPDKFATVRDRDNSALGVVGKEFVPLQNVEAFDVLDDLVGDGELLFDSAGSLKKGRVVFVSAKLPQTIQVAGGSDEAELFLVLSHGHDGTRSISLDITPILPVCMNTLTLGASLAKSHFKVQHRSNARARLAEAGTILGITYDYVATMQRISDELAAAEMDLDASKRFMEKLYSDGVRDKGDNTTNLDGTLQTLQKSTNIREDTRYTAWGNLQAVTEWWDWRRPQRANDTKETRFLSTTEGVGKHYRERSLQLLTAR